MKYYKIAGCHLLVSFLLLITCSPVHSASAQSRGNEAGESGPNLLPITVGNTNLHVQRATNEQGWIDEDDLEELAEESMEESVAVPVAGSATPAAGNVFVSVDYDGDLIAIGDNNNNCIEIRATSVGEGRVDGCDGTLVNAGASAYFNSMLDDLKISMLGGDDKVTIEYQQLNMAMDDLEIRTGSGHDTITLRDVMIGDDLDIKVGSGNDQVMLISNVSIRGGTDIHTSLGNDQVLLNSVSSSNSLIFQGDFKVDTGSDRDFVHLCGAILGDEVDVELGHGDDLGITGSLTGGLYVCNSTFSTRDVLEDVDFDGGRGVDAYMLENVTGIAGPTNVFVSDFEQAVHNCTDLGGSEGCVFGR